VKKMIGWMIGTAGFIAVAVFVFLVVFEDPHIAQGRATFKKYCSGCHGVKGQGNGFNADYLDPYPRDLTDSVEPYMAEGTDEDIFNAISFGLAGVAPLENKAPELSEEEAIGSPLMPYWGFTLTDEEIWSLVAFIRTLHKNDQPPVEFSEDSKPQKLSIPTAQEVVIPSLDSVRGKQLVEEGKKFFFDRYGCGACHEVGDKGGKIGPALDRTGVRLQPTWIYRWIKNAQSIKRDTIMPNFALSDHDALAITLYLTTLRGNIEKPLTGM
jgi:mono/diheme cytochrome c family protein